MTQNIKAKECRFAVHMNPPEPQMPDLHLIKEVIHYEDGTTAPNLTFVKNYKRNYWVTRKGSRDHKSKKEWEEESKLLKFESTQAKLTENVAKSLDRTWANEDMRKLSESPYLYGSDISSTAIIKHSYKTLYPNALSPYTVAVMDTETDVLFGTDEVIMCTITYRDKVFTAVAKWFVEGLACVNERVEDALQSSLRGFLEMADNGDDEKPFASKAAKKAITTHLNMLITQRLMKNTLVLVDNAAQCVEECFKRAHEWKPDWVTFWNMDFDITKTIEACEKYEVDLAKVFSDPSVPEGYRFFKYKQGKKQKITASGKATPIKPAAQWHVVTCPASFHVIDSMCVYKQVRTGKPEEQSYSLDNILNLELGIRKLKFDDMLKEKHPDIIPGSLPWHELMQRDYKIEYIVYNIFDCMSVEMLDMKTKDLSTTMPVFAGISDFSHFNSQPRRMVDRLHFYVLEKEKVIGSTSSEMAEDLDDKTTDLSGWIVMLPAHLVADNGLQIVEEHPDLRTNIRAFVGDLDVSAS